jgi:anti-sigma factor ChrR (cupin superfamily)
MGRHPVVLALGALMLLIGLGVGGLALLSAARAAERTYMVRVPPGTAARIAAGEEVEVFPRTIRLKLSEHDTLVVRNDDSETVTVGPYHIEPGQRFVQHYDGPGTFDLICSIHGAEGLSIVVTR